MISVFPFKGLETFFLKLFSFIVLILCTFSTLKKKKKKIKKKSIKFFVKKKKKINQENIGRTLSSPLSFLRGGLGGGGGYICVQLSPPF